MGMVLLIAYCADGILEIISCANMEPAHDLDQLQQYRKQLTAEDCGIPLYNTDMFPMGDRGL